MERLRAGLPRPPRRSAGGLCNGDTGRSVAAEDGYTDPEFGRLAIEVAGPELLAEQLHAVHLRLYPGSAVVAASPRLEGPAKALDRARGSVPACRAGAVHPPRPGVAPGRDARLATLAEQAGPEGHTLLRRFRKATGLTTTEYAQRLRVVQAQELPPFGHLPVEWISCEVAIPMPERR